MVVVEMQDVAVFGQGCRRFGLDAQHVQQPLPAADAVFRFFRRRFFVCVDDRVGQSRRYGLFRRKPASVAVVFVHQRFEFCRFAASPHCIEFRQPAVGLLQQFQFAAQFRRIAFRRAVRLVDQVERIGRDLAASFARRLGDDRRRRGRVAVAAGRDAAVDAAQGVVDQQGVVHVAARRADVDYHFRRFDFADARHRFTKPVVGRDPLFGFVELPRFGYADRAFDVDVAGPGVVFDSDVRFQFFLVFRVCELCIYSSSRLRRKTQRAEFRSGS